MSIDRVVMAFAGIVILVSAFLAWKVSPNWLFLTGFVGFNLLQSSFTGFCPLAMILKKFGFKTGQAFNQSAQGKSTKGRVQQKSIEPTQRLMLWRSYFYISYAGHDAKVQNIARQFYLSFNHAEDTQVLYIYSDCIIKKQFHRLPKIYLALTFLQSILIETYVLGK